MPQPSSSEQSPVKRKFSYKKRLWEGGFLLIAITSLLLSDWLYGQLRTVQLKLWQSTLDPLALHRFTDEDLPTIEGNPLRVVLLGDSRIVQWPAPEMTDVVFINRGIGGQSSAQIRGRFTNDVPPLQPNVVLIQACANDLKLDPSLSRSTDALVQGCQQHLSDLVEETLAIGAVPILTTIFPLGPRVGLPRPLFGHDSSDGVTERVLTVNTFIRELGDRKQIPVLDTYKLLAENERVAKEFEWDWLHINKRGYAVINRSLVDLLASLETDMQ